MQWGQPARDVRTGCALSTPTELCFAAQGSFSLTGVLCSVCLVLTMLCCAVCAPRAVQGCCGGD
jgi:hypothetical protein